jgi:hypothetical protein
MSPMHGRSPLRETRRGALLKRLRAFRGRLPPDFRFDREEAQDICKP